jgi:hypothetical protein
MANEKIDLRRGASLSCRVTGNSDVTRLGKGSRPSAQNLVLCFLQPRFRIDSEFAIPSSRRCAGNATGTKGISKSSVPYTVSDRRSFDVRPSTKTAAV